MAVVPCTIMNMRIGKITNMSIRSIFRIIGSLLHSNFSKKAEMPGDSFYCV